MRGFQIRELRHSPHLKEMGIGCVLLVLLFLVGWVSVDKLLTIQKSQSQIQDSISLERDVSQLQSHYLEANPDTLDTDLQQAENVLIQSYTHLALWAQGLQEKSKQWNLLMQYRIVITDHTASPIQGVTVLPLEIQVHPQGTQSAYRPYLQFIKALTRSGPKVDIRNVTVMGDGQKATHLTIGLSVWMKTTDSVEL
jgi:hypothetical protein